MEKPKNDVEEDGAYWWTETEVCREFCRPHAVPRAEVEPLANQAEARATVADGGAKSTPANHDGRVGTSSRKPRGGLRALIRRLRGCGILA